MRRAGGAVVLVVLLVAVALTGCDNDDGEDAATTRAAVTVVAQNLLHGIACPSDTNRCKLPERVQLFARQLVEDDCPQVVALEEADPVMADLLRDETTEICDGAYELVTDDDPSVDREIILTSLPVLGQERVHLAGPLRTALWVRLKAALGPLDVVATHLASSSDDRPCDSKACPPPCKAADSLNTCQGRQAAAMLDEHRTPHSVGVLIGDLNAKPGEPTITAIEALGFVDTFTAAGHRPCDPTTGRGCTSGRADADLSDLTNPGALQAERIDYVFLATDRRCRVEFPTGLFAPKPAKAPIDGLVFASDHTGVQATISCITTPEDRQAAQAAASSSTTTTTTGSAVDSATAAEVTKAFETVFNGGTAIETRLGSLEDADLLRKSLIARYEDPAIQALADRIHVRTDSMTGVDEDTIDVVYSLLLDDTVVLDHLPGQVVREDGKWLVSRRTYCEVATQGESTIPEPCR